MEQFTKVTGIAAPMPWNNVNTDMISPKHVMKAVSKSGLSWGLFQEYRFNSNGEKNPDFILNKKPWDTASIIVSLENWGCGSSREHAVWAMKDYGIRSVIAISFADIHYNNCFKNGILPVCLAQDEVLQVLEVAKAMEPVTIDLLSCTVEIGLDTKFSFKVDEFRRDALLSGMDEIDQTRTQLNKIIEFEQQYKHKAPWIIRD